MNLPLHEFGWTEEAMAKDLERNMAYLIRPDGHIGLIAEARDIQRIEQFVERWALA